MPASPRGLFSSIANPPAALSAQPASDHGWGNSFPEGLGAQPHRGRAGGREGRGPAGSLATALCRERGASARPGLTPSPSPGQAGLPRHGARETPRAQRSKRGACVGPPHPQGKGATHRGGPQPSGSWGCRGTPAAEHPAVPTVPPAPSQLRLQDSLSSRASAVAGPLIPSELQSCLPTNLSGRPGPGQGRDRGPSTCTPGEGPTHTPLPWARTWRRHRRH